MIAEEPLLVQEAALAPVHGRPEEPVVEHVPQALGEGAQDLLLGHPHGGVGFKPHGFLPKGGREEVR